MNGILIRGVDERTMHGLEATRHRLLGFHLQADSHHGHGQPSHILPPPMDLGAMASGRSKSTVIPQRQKNAGTER